MKPDILYGMLAFVIMLDAYALVALIGHTLGIKAWRKHPPIIVPATVALGLTVALVAFKLMGMMVRIALLG